MSTGTIQKSDILEIQDASTLGILAKSEIDMQISTAKKYPRDMLTAIREAKRIVQISPSVAETMGYALPPRKGSDERISGPSVRLAEVLAYSWKNLRYGSRVLDIEERYVVAQGICHDLENNIFYSHETRRGIYGKHGRYGDDMIRVTCNAACAIAMREAIFHVIPRALAAEVYDAAMKRALGEEKPIPQRFEEAAARFAPRGITKDQLLSILGVKNINEVTLAGIQYLIQLWQSIIDGEISVADAFAKEEAPFQRKPREEQPEPVIIETEPTAAIEAHVTVIPDSADSQPTEPSEVQIEPEFERRRRTQDIGNGLKTAGMTGEQWIEIQDYRGKLALGAEIIEMWLDEHLPTKEKRCSYLREEEAQALIDHLAMAWERTQASAPQAQPEDETPPVEAYEEEDPGPIGERHEQPSVKFRLGQHVETPSGIGIIEEIETENGKSRYFCRVVGENRIPVQEVFTESEIRPGRDPLEGLTGG